MFFFSIAIFFFCAGLIFYIPKTALGTAWGSSRNDQFIMSGNRLGCCHSMFACLSSTFFFTFFGNLETRPKVTQAPGGNKDTHSIRNRREGEWLFCPTWTFAGLDVQG